MGRIRHRGTAAILSALLAVGSIAALVLSVSDFASEDMLFGLWRMRHVAFATGLMILAIASACYARGAGAWLGFLASVIPVCLLLIVMELAGRMGLVNWAALLSPIPAQAETVGWSLRPDISVQGQTGQDIAARLGLPHDPIPFDFRADEYGFRNGDELGGNFIFLGDSIILGAAVPVDETIAEVTEDILKEPVMQAALLGLSIQGQHDMLRASGLPLAGRTVVQFLFEGNDLLDSHAYRHQEDRSAHEETGERSLGKLVWEKLVTLSNPAARYYTCMIDGQNVAFLWTRRSFDGVEGEVAHIATAIRDFRAELRRQDANYALVFVPTKYRVLEAQCSYPHSSPIANADANLSSLPGELKQFTDDENVRFIDLTPPLMSAAQKGVLPWFWGDTHWNSTGHATAGKTIAEWLSDADG
ncbi:alginate O-acetyltransferase AlgX-related protein [Roseovarius pelagicus]|uniref:AlgX/AlgJ SGNH hydrolase-like domain-containing protein n=1 Tax=Roseovarius pelagicus TaxID=2980108 RepID=A0ABY6D6F0_9RHOB|nr:hypothetical protein [Roseovarius pelagicus]UXX81711.1 hypothetical protein N7U68_11265 [Roseovarius pelagicus]